MGNMIKKIDVKDLGVPVDPIFYSGIKKSNKIPACMAYEQVLFFFEYRLKQDPKNLSCHLQRIQFSLSKKNRVEVFSAICDLYIILGSKGLPLRQRIFVGCKKILDKKQSRILKHYLVDEVLNEDRTFLPDSCYFKRKQLTLLQLRNSSGLDTQSHEDVLLTADSYIENSQFEIALEYMTTHLEQDIKNRALAVKLIELYKSLDYADEFQNSYKKFSNYLMTSQYWDNAKKYFQGNKREV